MESYSQHDHVTADSIGDDVIPTGDAEEEDLDLDDSLKEKRGIASAGKRRWLPPRIKATLGDLVRTKCCALRLIFYGSLMNVLYYIYFFARVPRCVSIEQVPVLILMLLMQALVHEDQVRAYESVIIRMTLREASLGEHGEVTH